MSNNTSLLFSSANMSSIEQAHLFRGVSSKKTPLKWIRFFNLCVLQREKAEKQTKKKQRFIFLCFSVSIILTFIFFINLFLVIAIPSFLIMIVGIIRLRIEFKKKYTDNYGFFAKYFSAFLTLIEEEMTENGLVSLKINVKDTLTNEFLKYKEEPNHTSSSSRKKIKIEHYEKEICSGSFLLKDGSEAFFNFSEITRHTTSVVTSRSGKKTKIKNKYKSVYPFTLKMKFSKSNYSLKQDNKFINLQIVEDEKFFYLRTKRKFNLKQEKPEDYTPYSYNSYNSIQLFSVDYFTLEVMNLLNLCYGCFTLKQNS